MNTTSASPAEGTEAARAAAPRRTVLVWDAPVRVGHWLIALSFAGAWLTAESERWRLVHVSLGYTLAALVVFRIVWGLVGTRHARFASFVRGPATALRYLRSLATGHPEHHTGHNPAGALAIIALLGLGLVAAASGWATYNEVGGEWLEELHEGAANAMLALVVLHIAAVVGSSLLHRENLVAAMVSGRKAGRHDEAIRSAWRSVGVLMLAAVIGFWWLQWNAAPDGGAAGDAPAALSSPGGHHGRHHRDADD